MTDQMTKIAGRASRRMFLKGACASGAAIALASPAISQRASVRLTISHTWPATSAHQDHIQNWVNELERRSDGDVTGRIMPGGSLLGAREDWDGLTNGLADVVMGMRANPVGRPVGTALTALSSGLMSARAGQDMAYAVLENFPSFASEWEANELLWIAAHGPAQIHTNRAVETLDDMSGLQLRAAPSKSVVAMIEALGAVPVSMPMPSSYSALQKGTVDGIIAPWETLSSFKLGDVTTHTTNAALYAAPSFYVAMNAKTYADLPDDIRSVVDETRPWGRQASAEMWEQVDLRAVEEVSPERAAATFVLPAAERAAWSERIEPIRLEAATDLEDQGLPGNAIKSLIDEIIAGQS